MARLQVQSSALLTTREKEAFKWIKKGKNTTEIAMILGVRERTVKFHIGNILKKLNAVNRVHALAIAIEKRLLE